MLQRRSVILRRWTQGEIWAITHSGYVHHIDPDPCKRPRPFRTIDLTRQDMSIMGPVEIGGGLSMFEIGWKIKSFYLRNMALSTGTWVWTFRGENESIKQFVQICRALMQRHPQDIASQSSEEKAFMKENNADEDIPAPGDNATSMEVAVVSGSA